MTAADDKGAGSKRPRPAAAKPAPAADKPKADPADHPGPPIGIEPAIRVGGHVITDDGWTPEEGT